MNVETILQRARDLGITLRLAADRLEYGPKSLATDDFVEALRRHKTEILAALSHAPGPAPEEAWAVLLSRLRAGHVWLTEAHQKLMAEERLYDGMADQFTKGLDTFEILEKQLRETYHFQGCVMGEGQQCPAASPVWCLACVAGGKRTNELRQ